MFLFGGLRRCRRNYKYVLHILLYLHFKFLSNADKIKEPLQSYIIIIKCEYLKVIKT